MIIDLEEVKNWLRIDGEEENATLDILIGAAETYLLHATGRTYDDSHNQAKLFCLVLVADWYENRELMGDKPSEKVRYSIQSIMSQLQYSVEVNTNG
jgi:uncharacterized phage protein (predicted DNA packaging)